MVTSLELTVQLSDLFEAAEAEGGLVVSLFDQEIMPLIRKPLHEIDAIGLGDKFNDIIDRVRSQVQSAGSDSIRNLSQMMKFTLSKYVKLTHDVLNARNIYHKAVMGGGDTMLTVTAAGMLAIALAAQHPDQATSLMQKIAGRLGGAQVRENSSGAAVSAGAIASVPMMGKKKKLLKRRDSIFAETLTWRDVQDLPATIDLMEEISRRGREQHVDGTIIDPTTAELVLSVHRAMLPHERREYEIKPMAEMIQIAEQWVRDGLLSVIMEED